MHQPAQSIPDAVFYRTERPPPEPGFLQRGAATPLRFGLVLFLVGWAGILVQRSFLQQVVVGAPLFEEAAKLGLALLVVAPLGARSLAARLPYAWLSGLGFGVLEHYLTYSGEPLGFYLLRVAFHATTTGLSMAMYSLLEPLPDVRMRWASTVGATLLHWANNFGAVLIGLLALALPLAEAVGLAWSVLVTLTATVATFYLPSRGEGERAWLQRELSRVFPPVPPLTGRTAPPPAGPAPLPPAPAEGAEAEPGPRSSAEPAGEPAPQAPEPAPPEPQRPREEPAERP